MTTDKMIEEQALHIISQLDPDEKEWKRVILSSYAHLRKKLQEMDYQYNQARAFLYNS